MTKKLYYQDPYITTFKANILRQDQDDEGNRFVLLDKTAFYPTGGGQPNDEGMLNDVRVTGVEEIDGEVFHFVTDSINDKEVTGKIDWNRRFDHMQQHAGQHVLSAIFEEELSYKTVSFHLGKEICTIDLDVENVTKEQIEHVESRVNQVVLENKPIETKWVNQEEVKQYRLRKQLSVTDNIRLVIIPDLDYNGCGGTHPNSTGQVVSLKILGVEKQRKQVRVQFICGQRIISLVNRYHQVIQDLTQLVSAPDNQIFEKVNQIILGKKEVEQQLEELKEQLLTYEAKSLLVETNNIYSSYQDRSVKELQKLATTIVKEDSRAFVLLVNETENKLQFVCARGKERGLSMKELVKGILPLINGKGGGNDLIAQGGGDTTMSGNSFLDEVKAWMNK